MIKTLFSFLLCFCGIYSISAQYSISYDSTDPVTVVAGQSITLNYTYTASMQVGAQFQIFETDVSGIFGGATAIGTAVAEFPTLDAGTDVMGTITLNIPANFPLSSSLSGTEYRIFGKLSSAMNSDATEDATWDTAGAYPLITVTAPPYSITYDSGNPVSVAAGESITLNYTYSASMDVDTQFQIFEADVPGIFGGATANGTGVIVTPTVTAGTDVSTTITLDIPSDFPTSSSLSGTKYYIFGKLSSAANSDASSDADWSVAGAYPEITINENTLSINDFTSFDRDKLYFNSTSTSLVINDTNEIKSLNIYNVIGKKVFEIENIKNTTNVDLSALPKGLYIARSDSKFLKFVR
ncbi:T9SS C-terminal target domain-containing protein [Aquimarina sp. BL5]|uniref:T9SS type A sorting domain-containing protein n=1 Tax=Aquimarina sp. BL5 TaxID=1714860 RepID=UPI000E4F1A8A|nr:T9SS type A sorting domain-containing protein [Aquimarina sp. BL5]AXT53720.1 T9SS C-terminal target domain-containing protein [Aquimarina sp. BL5]RKN06769.1 T9SS C-terminal target domain-containing protein [Aquimarina sp. BL5]